MNDRIVVILPMLGDNGEPVWRLPPRKLFPSWGGRPAVYRFWMHDRWASSLCVVSSWMEAW